MRYHCHPETGRLWLYNRQGRNWLSFEVSGWKNRSFRIGMDTTKRWTWPTFYLAIPFLFSVFVIVGDGDAHNKDYETSFKIHGWSLWFAAHANTMEWNRSDPWWRKSHSMHLPTLFLGKERYTTETLSSEPVEIPMPEGVYKGIAKHERQTWKRPFGRKLVRESIWIDVEKGVPFPGKGENSWDCGMDGLYGTGHNGTDVEAAIGYFVGCVLKNRRRYGGKGWKLEKEVA